MNASDYHDLCFSIRCAFCSRAYLASVYDADGNAREWRPCDCASSQAVGQVGMRYEHGELKLARMPRVKEPRERLSDLLLSSGVSFKSVGSEARRLLDERALLYGSGRTDEPPGIVGSTR